MKKNRWMFLSIAVIIVVCAVKVYAGSLSMTTYYPAPSGYYDTLKVGKFLIIPCYDTTASHQMPASIPVNSLYFDHRNLATYPTGCS